ncbi:antibiotic biosynthesis monooxygenase [Crossiella sp. SN42]|uniref:antibiotic biosynthesis monooxygenase family protein n=1 Tax=Crossiella sp. SN42 TaxID=2944808 RepID=UPI00207CA744|nr:antibiotic biosynthesis monooxygenase family protein [Crossiella sp. SN42]MCO1576063.1 antibiotic biosynthesis monooxygenase [Crossiella sp. SN42]
MSGVTFVNRFTVQGDPEEFERAFAQVAKFMADQPGIKGYTLSRHSEDPRQYVNIAVWTDAGALRAAVAHPEFGAHVGALRALAVSESDLYLERHAFVG